MNSPLMDPKEIRKSDSGQITIPVADIITHSNAQDVNLRLSAEYAKLGQDHPEHLFGIVRDDVKGTVTIMWRLRE